MLILETDLANELPDDTLGMTSGEPMRSSTTGGEVCIIAGEIEAENVQVVRLGFSGPIWLMIGTGGISMKAVSYLLNSPRWGESEEVICCSFDRSAR
jgi:hypothetical protein